MSESLARRRGVSAEEYLAGERVAEIRHEYVNGEVFAMTGVTKTHNRLTQRLARLASDRLAGGPCEVFTVDVKVRVRTLDDDRFYYPDLYVECPPFTEDPYYSERPTLIVEVLSETTERTDRSDKFYAYRRLASLEEYVLVAQDARRVEVYRRQTGWDLELYGAGQSLRLAALGGELGGDIAVDALYDGIVPGAG